MDFGGGDNVGGGLDLIQWYMDIPPISRVYFTSAVLTTAGCAMDIISPYSLYFNFDLIFVKGQVWRLFTSFLFFGTFSFQFMFHMYFLVRYCRLLEEGDFRGRRANFALMLLFGIVFVSFFAPFMRSNFLGNTLSTMMTYVWGRRNEDVKLSILGVFTCTAPYLPWVMLCFTICLGGDGVVTDLVGIMVGHLYYFLEFVYPVLADIRDWRIKRILEPPRILTWICGDNGGMNQPDHAIWHQE
mmetsp:Transcript_18292/g.25808  ORF Transcript_18292/g.25808 Transcript_18292/m.25808 type:complete len:242 (+) Transcript_18292:128-853(+)